MGTEGILGETLNCVITLTAKSCPGLENFTEEMSQMSPVPVRLLSIKYLIDAGCSHAYASCSYKELLPRMKKIFNE